MMIIQDAHILKAETTMIGDNNSIIKEDEINDLSITKMNNETILKRNDDLFKSPNKRKQIKPNRVTNDDEPPIPTDLTNGHSSPSPPPPPPPLPPSDNSSDSTKQQEAYCNLCERSFCNKYFLKTHFAKKHGGPPHLISPSSESNNHQSSPSSPSAILTTDQPLPLIVNEKLSEDYCEICQKRFCNKYYLRKHKGECHGVYTDYIKSLQKSANDSPVKNTPSRPTQASLLNPFYLPSDIKPSITNEVPSSPPQRPIRRCNVCQQEFRNKALLRMHMNTFHSNETTKKQPIKLSPTPSLSFPMSPSTNLGFLQPFVDTTSPLAHKLVAGQAPQASYGILHDSYFCAKMADRVVCEICNKQVCNKYFLKTHKAKVHGILNGNTSNDNSDHTPPTMVPIPADNDPIIKTSNDLENSETYCSICKKDLSTKYLYLFHMQTIHNDTSDPTYQSLMEFMKAANAINEPLATIESGDESDGNMDRLKRKRSISQSSTETNKRINSLTEANGGLQPFLLESEDPKFAHTFVPCMVYLPVIKRVTKQVKINLRLKPVLADASS